MESNDLNKLIIKVSAFVFLFLGLAVVFIEYWFFYRNTLSQSIAGILLILCSFIFVMIVFVYLSLRFDFLGLKKDRKRKRRESL